MNVEEIILSVQAHLPGLVVDGKAGPKTWEAIYAKVVGELPSIVVTDALVDERSERAIATLHPNVRNYARALVNDCASQGIKIIVTSGTRTYDEQNALYAQKNDGKDNDGDGRVDESDENVTGARGGYSSHNFGIAFDITLFEGTRPIWDSPLYKVIGAAGMKLGLAWGGSWSSRIDEPHFYLIPSWAKGLSESEMMAGLRKRVADKAPIY